MSKVNFIKVTDGASKLKAIVQSVQEHLDNGRKIIIAVPNQESAVFLDQVLWKLPEESFSPHSIAVSSTEELVAITTSTTNLNNACVLINLLPAVHPNSAQYEFIVDLNDLTHPSKEELSLKRQLAYTEAGISIVMT